jgi:uncharacterized protein
MKKRFEIPQDKLHEFCRHWKITELALFGSALRNDFSSESDIDLLVRFAPTSSHTLFEMVQIQEELSEIFGRNVDLVSRRGIESSRNPIRRKAILDSAEVIYAT